MSHTCWQIPHKAADSAACSEHSNLDLILWIQTTWWQGTWKNKLVFSVSFEESAYTLGSEQGAVRIFIAFTDHQACKFTVNSWAASLRCPRRWLVAVAPPNWWSSLPCNFHTAQAVSFELQVHALGKGARSGEGLARGHTAHLIAALLFQPPCLSSKLAHVPLMMVIRGRLSAIPEVYHGHLEEAETSLCSLLIP